MPRTRDSTDRPTETDANRHENDDSRTKSTARTDGGHTETAGRQQQREGRPPESDRRRGIGGWVADAALQWGVVLLGFVLLLFALGQAVGADLLAPFVDLLTSQTGLWLLVALFALAIIAAARRGIR